MFVWNFFCLQIICCFLFNLVIQKIFRFYNCKSEKLILYFQFNKSISNLHRNQYRFFINI
ncbi:hypothetical protein BpHYR1_003665 [Brachionus plicatilis]|uniref:Uncharacterized protein n=1 Tax=Brachionus plicatilis TaxID=10195 RepID=A0A3M7R557_BRAPC|nr:hypothetical protein BpHYR1_003665 [Brachionus plicatilis]